MTNAKTVSISKNVAEFVGMCAEEVGKFETCRWEGLAIRKYSELKVSSPIEQIFFIAFKTIATLNHLYDELALNPQFKVDQYRVDFLAKFYLREEAPSQVIVECDSQKFHERTEKERKYEKKRDRFLISKGYKVFHFTGKEIIDTPFDVAGEVIAHLMDCDANDLIGDTFGL